MLNLSPIYSASKSSNQIIQKPQNQSCTQIHIKQNIHKHRTQNFRRNSPFGTTPVKKKKYIRLGHAGIVDHSVDLSIPDFKKVYRKKGMDGRNKKNLKYHKNA